MSDLERMLDDLSLSSAIHEQALIYLQDCQREYPDQIRLIVQKDLGLSFLKTLATSDYFAQTVLRRPQLLHALLDPAAPALDRENTDVSTRLQSITGYDESMAELRDKRHQHMLRILWRANGHLSSVESTLVELSALADHLVGEAVALSHRNIAQTVGEPEGQEGFDQLCVLAMGKLGGGELNMSSDVDVILTHSEAGDTRGGEGKRRISNAEFFARQAKQFSDLLARLTPDGFCYRVDTRLRPFGASGQPCVNSSALEHYLAVHGREWERYAYIKQRPLSGSDVQKRELKALLEPFVYRKYLDYGVFEELRSMKTLIDSEVKQRELQNNIKRGPGGIRELEFMVQTMQLIFGGKLQALQTPSFFSALNNLAELEFIPKATARTMYDDYCFLRRVENGVQGIRDEQTHVLPASTLNQERLVLLMQAESCDQLYEKLSEVRKRVQTGFDDLGIAGQKESPKSVTVSARETFAEVAKNDDLRSLLTLESLRTRLGQTSRKRLDRLMPQVVEVLQAAPDAEELAPRLARLLTGIGRRSAYFSLLIEHPAVLDRVVSICRSSPDLAAQLSVSPVLLDTLADPRGSSVALDRDGLSGRLRQQLEGLDPSDEEGHLIALREFHKAAIFDVAVADLERQMPLMKISDRLTDIAELVLEAAIALATAQMHERYGTPRNAQGEGEAARFAVVGYGKLGGIELGYGSDLDLVFLFDDDGDGVTDGEKSVDNSLYFARLSRRLIQILTVPTRAGTLYEVDMRLRPSGRSGLLVSRLSAFATYQRKNAWTWEHQALIRARAVAGDAVLRQDFESLRLALLRATRDTESLGADVRKMRGKMKAELDKSTAREFDLKQGEGGLVDCEFLVQYLVLAHSAGEPELAVYSDNVRQLEAIEAAQLLPAAAAKALRTAYVSLRQTLHKQSLAGQSVMVDQSEFKSERELILKQLTRHTLTLSAADPDIL